MNITPNIFSTTNSDSSLIDALSREGNNLHLPGNGNEIEAIFYQKENRAINSSFRDLEEFQVGRGKINRIRGTYGSEELTGTNKYKDIINGRLGNDSLIGLAKDDQLLAGEGNDYLNGGQGNDYLTGQSGIDTLIGGGGKDYLDGGMDQDFYTGGKGKDIIAFGLGDGNQKVRNADVLEDFEDGRDKLKLIDIGIGGFKGFSSLDILKGSKFGKWVNPNDTVIQHKKTGEFLLVIRNISPRKITASDFVDDGKYQPVEVEQNPTSIIFDESYNLSKIKLGNAKTLIKQEPEIRAIEGPSIAISPTRTIYIGYRQVKSNNQDPIVISIDRESRANTWYSTKIETSGADSKGYGLFWNGESLYGIFSVDGTQGTPKEDYRRATAGAAQDWTQTYGKGGGAKVAVLGRLNLKNGKLKDAAYLSSVLEDGKSNTLVVENIKIKKDRIVVEALSRFYPRNVDGSGMFNVGNTPAPFLQAIHISPDLKTVLKSKTRGVK
ncbi:MAG: calcium-binding protein [Cyanobacteria bacterium P01_F01_bin.150]